MNGAYTEGKYLSNINFRGRWLPDLDSNQGQFD